MTPDWTMATTVLAGGALVGTAATFLLRKSGAQSAHADEAVDLAAKRDEALARLRDLDDGSVALAPDALAAERQRLELDAARAMRDLDRPRKATQAVQRTAELRSGGPRYAWRWALGSAVFGVVLVLVLRESTALRPAGGALTGRGAGPAEVADEEAPPASDPDVAALEKQVAQDPDNLELRLDLADLYLRSMHGYVTGFKLTKSVLARDPDNARALVQQALVRNAMGMHAAALELVDRVVARDPKNVRAWAERAKAAAALGREPVAQESFEKAVALDASIEEALEADLDAARAAGSRAAEPTGAAPHPTAMTGAPAMAAAPAPSTAPTAIHGTIDLDPALAGSVGQGAFIFVALKEESGAPMPIAAKRLPVGAFPLSFSVGPEDAMTGRPIPDHVRVEARLDEDGSASTRAPTDPIARVEHVAAGTSGVSLVLRAP